MRRLAMGLGLFALSACALQGPPDRVYPVFFTDFSSDLDPTGVAVVANAAALAQKYPLLSVKVTGYADNAGSPAADVALSQARANAVSALLQQDGIVAGRIIRSAVGTPPNSQPGVERRRVVIDIDTP